MTNSLKNRLVAYRYLSIVAVITSICGAALMFVLGVVKTFKAFAIFLGQLANPLNDDPEVINKSIAFLVQSIDAFLIGMIFIVFSYGVTTLFITKIELPESSVFGWARITDIKQLKAILGEMIVIILFVKFLELILLSAKDITFEMLVLPVGIVLLALALKFLDLEHKEKK